MGGNNTSVHQSESFRGQLPSGDVKSILLGGGGVWKVARTTLPLWIKGDKLSPTLNYSQDETNEGRIHDTVKYVTAANGREETIVGGDTWPQECTCPGYLLWRGTGVLSLITSEWYVLLQRPTSRVVVIYFLPTLFTPEGVDVLVPVGDDGASSIVSGDEIAAAISEGKDRFPMLSHLLDTLQQLPSA